MSRPRVRYPIGGRDAFEVTVSYRRDDGQVICSRVGWGKTYQSAIEHADEQLPVGTWERLVVSTRNSVYADVQNAGRPRGNSNRARRFEGVSVTVSAPERSR